METENELIKKFFEIKNREWIQTNRHGDQCLGNTFEDLVGVKENNRNDADYNGIELKARRSLTSSLMSLFTKSPSFPRGVNTYLRLTYGVDEEQTGQIILNTTVSGAKFNTHRGGHSFKIEVDREEEKLWLIVKETASDRIIDGKNCGKQIFWTFDVLRNALKNKLDKIALVDGQEKIINGIHYVKFTSLYMIHGLTLEKLISAIEKGDLFVDIRLGVYKSGKNIGKTHDHGTGFRIKEDKLLTEYASFNIYE